MTSRAARLMQYTTSRGLLAVLNSRLPNCGEKVAAMCDSGLRSIEQNRRSLARATKLVMMKNEALQSIRTPRRTFD